MLLKTNLGTRKKPGMVALWRAVASSFAIETGQSTLQLEQKRKEPAKHRFAHVKLAASACLPAPQHWPLASSDAYLEQFEVDLVAGKFDAGRYGKEPADAQGVFQRDAWTPRTA